jgi:hypothetical protein
VVFLPSWSDNRLTNDVTRLMETVVEVVFGVFGVEVAVIVPLALPAANPRVASLLENPCIAGISWPHSHAKPLIFWQDLPKRTKQERQTADARKPPRRLLTFPAVISRRVSPLGLLLCEQQAFEVKP